MQQQIQIKPSNVNLDKLASRLAKNFDLELTTDNEVNEELMIKDINLILEHKLNFESLTLARNYSEKALDFEQISIDHYLGENEKTMVTYFASNVDYFKRTFQDLGETNNEFLAAIKRDYDEILAYKSKKLIPRIKYKKRIANHQKTLEELFNYAALKWSGSKVSA
ncbi:MAG: hypothetical protein AABW57_01190 [Nanoarchaeota archaeon]